MLCWSIYPSFYPHIIHFLYLTLKHKPTYRHRITHRRTQTTMQMFECHHPAYVDRKSKAQDSNYIVNVPKRMQKCCQQARERRLKQCRTLFHDLPWHGMFCIRCLDNFTAIWIYCRVLYPVWRYLMSFSVNAIYGPVRWTLCYSIPCTIRAVPFTFAILFVRKCAHISGFPDEISTIPFFKYLTLYFPILNPLGGRFSVAKPHSWRFNRFPREVV